MYIISIVIIKHVDNGHEDEQMVFDVDCGGSRKTRNFQTGQRFFV